MKNPPCAADRAARAADPLSTTVQSASPPGPDRTADIGKPAAAPKDQPAEDIRLDQFYTRSDVAAHCIDVVSRRVDMQGYLWIEPSAGAGAFLFRMPPGSRGYDIAPKAPGIEQADFLTLTLPRDHPLAFLGNPPFGRNASLAVRVFNRAASQGDVIAFILPRSFRKASIQNRPDRRFHLIHDEDVDANAFEFRGAPYDVPATFQIWIRRHVERPLHPVETRHPDFVFTTPARAHFVVQRVGARAGRIHRNFGASPNSHYFIRAASGGRRMLLSVMAKLNLAGAASNVAGNPSLAKSEIVSLYRSRTGA